MDVFLTISDTALGVPYFRAPDDQDSASYIDLKLTPEKIDDVPEAREWPVIRELLIAINSPQSQLLSIGCGVFIYPPSAEQVPWTAFAYVGYGLKEFELATDAKVYFPQFFHFTQHNRSKKETGANVFFELRQTSFHDLKKTCFTVDFIVRAWGSSEAELRARIDSHFRLLHEFLPLMGLMPL